MCRFRNSKHQQRGIYAIVKRWVTIEVFKNPLTKYLIDTIQLSEELNLNMEAVEVVNIQNNCFKIDLDDKTLITESTGNIGVE